MQLLTDCAASSVPLDVLNSCVNLVLFLIISQLHGHHKLFAFFRAKLPADHIYRYCRTPRLHIQKGINRIASCLTYIYIYIYVNDYLQSSRSKRDRIAMETASIWCCNLVSMTTNAIYKNVELFNTYSELVCNLFMIFNIFLMHRCYYRSNVWIKHRFQKI